MRSSKTNSRYFSRRTLRAVGFTLLELLVVVLIVGLGISLVTLSVGDSDGYKLRSKAKELINNAALVSEEAIMSGDQWGIDLYLDIDENGLENYGYRWLQRKPERWEVAAPPQIAADNPLDPNLIMILELEGVEQEIGFKQTESQIGLSDDTNNGADNIATDNSSREPLLPDIWLLSSGEVSPFLLTLKFKHEDDISLRLKSDLLGRFELVTEDDELEI